MKLPVKTIQEAIDRRETIWVHCHASHCWHHSKLDLIALRDRLGPDHGAMHDDLVPKLRCSKCRGPKGKNIGLSLIPDTKEYRAHPYAEK